MNKKEVSEIKNFLPPAGCAITRICGCYVRRTSGRSLRRCFPAGGGSLQIFHHI